MDDGYSGGCAIVLGAEGRVGSAFARRLRADGFVVLADPADLSKVPASAWLFDCAYRDGDPAGHVARVAGHLARWRDYSGIFIPSSAWIDTDSDYARAKRVVEALVAFHVGQGAHIVTDRIGYFPGDGVAPDPTEPMLAHAIDGDTLYARVMAMMFPAGRNAACSGEPAVR